MKRRFNSFQEYKTLNVVSDTDSSYLRRGDGCESGLKRVHLKPTLIGLNMEFEALMVKRWFVVPKNSVRYRTNSQNCLHSLIGKILEYESRDVGVRLFLGTQKSLLI